ncbi:centrosomal protein of 85 kDa [Rhinophrynus dorsalis]
MATVDRLQGLGFQRPSRAGPSQTSSSSHTDWQTPLVSGKSICRTTGGPAKRGGNLPSASTCPENIDDFCNASGSTTFQPIRSQVTIPTAHVMPSTLGTAPNNTSEPVGAPLPADPALHVFPFLPSSEPTTAEDTRRFEMPNIEPTLNQSALLNIFCTDPRPTSSTLGVRTESELYGSLPEVREATGGELIHRAGPIGATNPHSQVWRPEPYSLQPGAELSAWRQQQQQQQQHTENMRLKLQQLQVGRSCPPPPIYHSGLQPDSSQWERVLKASENVLLEKEMLMERQRQHISQLEQKLRESEVHVHGTLLNPANPYGDMYMMRLQELQREVTFLRAQFAEKTDSSSREKAALERKLCVCEEEAKGLREGIKEAAQKHAEELKKQEERVKGRDRHINSLKKKCQKETEQNKEKQQRIETLERYLADLPTVQDHQRQMQELKELQEKRNLLQGQVDELERKLGDARANCREKEAQLEAEKKQGKQLMSTVDRLKEEVESFKRTEVGEKERLLTKKAEDLQQEVQSLQKERECLKKVAESQKKKMEQMYNQVKGLKEQISQEEGTGQALKEEAQRKETALQQLRTAMKELVVQNQDLMEQNVTLQERLRQAGGVEQSVGLETGNLLTMYRELNLCLKDLNSICNLMSQRMEGKDPNLSLLLGIHSVPVTEDQDGTMDQPCFESHLNGVRQLKRNIEELRTAISDRYAQDMGDNCITQ